FVTSLKKNAELYDVNAAPFVIRHGVTFGHYELLSKDTLFWSWFVNSLLVSVAATVIYVVVGILAAYSLARLGFLGAHSFAVAVPGVICAALFAFTLSWNEFLYSRVFV